MVITVALGPLLWVWLQFGCWSVWPCPNQAGLVPQRQLMPQFGACRLFYISPQNIVWVPVQVQIQSKPEWNWGWQPKFLSFLSFTRCLSCLLVLLESTLRMDYLCRFRYRPSSLVSYSVSFRALYSYKLVNTGKLRGAMIQYGYGAMWYLLSCFRCKSHEIALSCWI